MTKQEKVEIIRECHKLLDRAEEIFDEMVDHIIANGEKYEW